MNITFLTRKTLASLSGGDSVQIEGTRKALEARGHRVTVVDGPSPEIRQSDLVHGFNPSLLSPALIQRIRTSGTPLVLSTIHWDMREYFNAMLRCSGRYLALRPRGFGYHFVLNAIRALGYRFLWNPVLERRLSVAFRTANLLLPNSEAEAELLVRQFGMPRERVAVVVNGVDTTAPQTPKGRFTERYGVQDFILCVGRIEYRKNQLSLIEALIDFDAPLVFIGRPLNAGYTSLCRTLARQRRAKTLFLDHMPSEQVREAYADARVHALVSWYETPGLASLEAGLAGTNLVVSDRGCTREYFEPYAEFCEPNDASSIRSAVEQAFVREPSVALSELIQRRYTWDQAAKQSLAAYRLAGAR